MAGEVGGDAGCIAEHARGVKRRTLREASAALGGTDYHGVCVPRRDVS